MDHLTTEGGGMFLLQGCSVVQREVLARCRGSAALMIRPAERERPGGGAVEPRPGMAIGGGS